MKIIFLDIDGVLNNELWYKERSKLSKAGELKNQTEKEYDLSNLDPENVAILSGLIVETGAKVVISSTWRKGHKLEYLQELLEEKGFCGEIVGYTPVFHYTCNGKFKGNAPRGLEIQQWLKEHGEEVTNYIILDDDSDMLYNQRDKYFQIDPYCGITVNNAYRAKRFLNNEYGY